MPKLIWEDRTLYDTSADAKKTPIETMRAHLGTDHNITISRESGEWVVDCPPLLCAMPLMLPKAADPEKAQERAVGYLRDYLIELLSWLK